MSKFISYTRLALPYTVSLFFILLVCSLYMVFISSPPDYKQGEFVRIMYLHVPSAWISLGSYTLMAIFSFIALVWRNVISAILSHAIAPLGLTFTFICLITGSIWGKCTWGIWWVWDARLTSMLVLLFLYLGYLSLWNFFDNESRSMKAASIFAIFSAINIPVIKFSVNIWTTLHQPASIFRKSGIAIDISMLIPLLTMFATLSLLFCILLILRSHTLINLRKINSKLILLNNIL
ncbi:heme ABC transporter permease [Ehrlichia canis]|uniref:Cytochrome c-type biogenesis protein CcmC n=1 Tax=Ehrlichia canis (strain Jake) TaxID=269484 RepID=A0ACA6AWA2_EHRCJ|nr:heme ABC transporter permease [Ehrlichia canis]AAZ68714.1 Cytochrome c-type biogenesis protein CcmC [Ehrlichia canis str. Jake]AUO54555.1 ABC transporter [Ehrlichia canis]UKC53493.1 heme ABC transporter permease [Ehrlichia canis]UKC54431.1 heme ABC transporter permease [Ehrlichia canis]UKC55368.1 heme ABC transporter permease [Ehrlichia canis]